jgi:hypothetical protein
MHPYFMFLLCLARQAILIIKERVLNFNKLIIKQYIYFKIHYIYPYLYNIDIIFNNIVYSKWNSRLILVDSNYFTGINVINWDHI